MALKYDLISTVDAMEIKLHNKFLTQILLGKQTGMCYGSTQRPYLVSRKKNLFLKTAIHFILYKLTAAC
jgi:hypothetical protein